MSILICEQCQHHNQKDARFCIMCGNPLSSTLRVPPEQLRNVTPEIRWGTMLFEEGFQLELKIGDGSIIMPLKQGNMLTLGRGNKIQQEITTTGPLHSFSPANSGEPIVLKHAPQYLDLSAFGATDAGVSREHARLTFQGHLLTVEDLDSTNGTRLNGSPLVPHKKRLIRNEDELLLGFLSVTFQFHRDKTEQDTTERKAS